MPCNSLLLTVTFTQLYNRMSFRFDYASLEMLNAREGGFRDEASARYSDADSGACPRRRKEDATT